jgi:hypothetical protein
MRVNAANRSNFIRDIRDAERFLCQRPQKSAGETGSVPKADIQHFRMKNQKMT